MGLLTLNCFVDSYILKEANTAYFNMIFEKEKGNCGPVVYHYRQVHNCMTCSNKQMVFNNRNDIHKRIIWIKVPNN